jgi:hypothetical protein
MARAADQAHDWYNWYDMIRVRSACAPGPFAAGGIRRIDKDAER